MRTISGTMLLTTLALLLSSCGTSVHDCTPTPLVVTVSPASATADHTAAPPANQVQFAANVSGGTVPSGCAVPAVAMQLQWAVADTTDVSFGSTNGLATCVNATSGTTTVTATARQGNAQGSGTATLTCN